METRIVPARAVTTQASFETCAEKEETMKKLVTTAGLLLALTGVVSVRANPPDINGSDTLEAITRDLVTSNCRDATNANLAGLLNYIGGGSTTGSNALLAQLAGTSQQVAAPMSRSISTSECNAAEAARAGTKATVQGLVFGLDGIVIVSDSQNTETCGGGHTAHADDEAPGPAFSDLPVATASWKNVLNLLYTGVPLNPGNPADNLRVCDTQARKDLAANYKGLFEGGCSNSGVCSTGIGHAFRRGDLSGTTDTFLSLIGAPSLIRSGALVTKTPFCNGLETEDRDPIRRPCTQQEQVCEYDGTLGLVLPIVVPTNTNEPAALYNASNSADTAVNPTFKNVDPMHGDVAYFGKIKSARGTACPNAPDATVLTYDTGVPTNPALNGVPLLAASVKDATTGQVIPGAHFSNDVRCDCRYPTPDSYNSILDTNNVAHVVLEFDQTNPSVRQTPPPKSLSWNRRFQGGCPAVYHPNDAVANTSNVRWGVLNGDDGIGDNTPATWGTTQVMGGLRRCCRNGGAFYKMDPRLMNLAVRNPTLNSPATLAGSLLGGEGTGPASLKWATISAFYRIHSNDLGLTAVPSRNIDPTFPGAFDDGVDICQQQDATRQIGCLVQIPSTCSVGFAGREAGDSTVTLTAEPFAIGGIDPTIANIQRLIPSPATAYPLSRRLYYNTLLGFGSAALPNPNGPATNYANAQFNLYKCLADVVSPRDDGIAAVTAALDTAGFVEVPGGPQMCNNMCTSNTSCSVLSAVTPAHLVPAFVP
jgi:hypothetical protein